MKQAIGLNNLPLFISVAKAFSWKAPYPNYRKFSRCIIYILFLKKKSKQQQQSRYEQERKQDKTQTVNPPKYISAHD